MPHGDQILRPRTISGGVFWPPYTAAEKRQMDAIDCRKPHSGSYVVVYPHARGEGRRVQSYPP
jgi:hypothetical protein